MSTCANSSNSLLLIFPFAFSGAAATAEMNLLKTLKYGGRRTDPGPAEMEQLVVFVYAMINLKSIQK